MLVPFDERVGAPTLPRIADITDEFSADELIVEEDVELESNEERVFVDIARCTDRFWRLDRLYTDPSLVPALLVALTRLEMLGLVERHGGGVTLTSKGSRLARRLDSTA